MAIDTTLAGLTSEGYVQATDVIAYANKHLDRYSAVTSANVTQAIEPAIRRCSAWVDGLARDPTSNRVEYWPGIRKVADQALDWPRSNAARTDGTPIDGNTIPFAIINATCEATCYEIINPNTLQTQLTYSEITKSTGIGPLKEMTMGAMDISDARLCLTIVKDYLSKILRLPSKNRFMMLTNDTNQVTQV